MTDEFINSFINEARELLFLLENDLLMLEKTPENRQIIDNVFRIMHNLKGAAGMYGFDGVQDLAHEFENIFDQIRSAKLKVTKALINDTLKGKDMLMSILSQEEPSEAYQDFLKYMANQYGNKQHGVHAEVDPKLGDQISEEKNFCIFFFPDKGIYERGLNPEKVIKEISGLGKVKIISHNGNSDGGTEDKNVCHTTWEIYLYGSHTFREISEAFLFYDEDEYKVFEQKDDLLNIDPDLIDIYRQYYPEGTSWANHLQSCMDEISNEFALSQPHTDAVEIPEMSDEYRSSFLPKSIKDTTIRVSSQKLDELMNLVSELVINTATLNAHASMVNDLRFSNLSESLEKLTKKFRNNALELRLVPVGSLLRKFNRQVRDLSVKLDKKVDLILEGQETEIDKSILMSIESPLMHIIRNSIDHGIESPEERLQKRKTPEGKLKISAFYSGANVVIQVHDDGRGINLDKIRENAIKKGYIEADQQVTNQELLNLIMEPGFTTSDKVSMVSGRGVGMNVVKRELNAIGGGIEIETEKDLGTSITMKLPTTLSIIDTLMLEVDKSYILVPLLEVEYCYKESRENIFEKGSNYVQYKNNLVPFISLRHKFKFPDAANPDEMVVIICKYEKKYAIIVDEIIGEHQAVIKPLGELFVNQPYYSGGSILADGNLALMLDTNYLFNQSVLN